MLGSIAEATAVSTGDPGTGARTSKSMKQEGMRNAKSFICQTTRAYVYDAKMLELIDTDLWSICSLEPALERGMDAVLRPAGPVVSVASVRQAALDV